MIHIEDGKANMNGTIITLVSEIEGLMEALNKAFPPDTDNGDFFWSALFSGNTKRKSRDRLH